MNHYQPGHHQLRENHPHITTPTSKDVLNGRGQGVQRHPGNVKYRTLVSANKYRYAKCQKADKIKISKGIVDAVRRFGGRFLELDERAGIYEDIGDKKATEKTSQALREGQKKIREKSNEDGGNEGTIAAASRRENSAETNYFEYSLQVLQSLYESENRDLHASTQMLAAPSPTPTAPSAAPSTAVNSVAMSMAPDQFPRAAAKAENAAKAETPLPPPHIMLTASKMPPPPPQQRAANQLHPSLIGTTADRFEPSNIEGCSTPRLTDTTFWGMLSLGQGMGALGDDRSPNQRSDSSNSKTSLMNASMMTIPSEDMSVDSIHEDAIDAELLPPDNDVTEG